MEIRLNPLWSIRDKKAWVTPIVSAVVFVIVLLVAISNPEAMPVPATFGIILLVSNVMMLITNYPHSLRVDEGTFVYEKNYFLRYRHSSKNRKRIRTRMTVTRIDAVELHQNALEKLFNTGHVVIKGHADVEFLRDYSDYYTDQIYAPTEHVLYGIKDFERFRNSIYDYVDPGLLTISVK